MPAGASEPLVLLTGYDAKRCARRIHNEWDRTIEKAPLAPPPELQARFDRGREFEADVCAELSAALGPARCVDLRGARGKQEAIAATIEAMDAGVEVILGGWLPDDETGARTGRPDVLLRDGTSAGGIAAYVPGDIKAHLMTRAAARGRLTYSRVGAPAERIETAGRAVRATDRFDDFLQVAHYWRMLEAIGRTPKHTAPVGLVIGTDDLPDLAPEGTILTWLALAEPAFDTFSRSEGTKRRTAMERYDHEQAFRVKVALVAARRTGEAGQPSPLVDPIFTHECDGCPWTDYCRSIADPATASAHLTAGRLSVREWQALAVLGVTTVEDLAEIDPDDEGFQGSYLPEVAHRKDAVKRLRDAVRRSRMVRDNLVLDRDTSGPVDVMRSDVEVDFDIEWDEDNCVYLWGALISRPGQPAMYRPFVNFDVADDEAERALASDFADWLRSEISTADSRGETLRVFHYSGPEPSHLKRLLGADAVDDLVARFVDLHAIVRQHFFGRDGLGVKQVAPAFGFAWRDEDPGGLQSQLWLVEARTAEDSEVRDNARARILAYNEDDVRATHAIRNGLSGH